MPDIRIDKTRGTATLAADDMDAMLLDLCQLRATVDRVQRLAVGLNVPRQRSETGLEYSDGFFDATLMAGERLNRALKGDAS